MKIYRVYCEYRIVYEGGYRLVTGTVGYYSNVTLARLAQVEVNNDPEKVAYIEEIEVNDEE